MKYRFQRPLKDNLTDLQLGPCYCKGFIKEKPRITTSSSVHDDTADNELGSSVATGDYCIVLQVHKNDYNEYLVSDKAFTTLRSTLIYRTCEVRFTMSIGTTNDMDVFWVRDHPDDDLGVEDCMVVSVRSMTLYIGKDKVKTIEIGERFQIACLLEKQKLTIACDASERVFSLLKNFNETKWYMLGCRSKAGQSNYVKIHALTQNIW